MDLQEIISSFSYIAIFVLMLTNGVANLPSSQILYVIVGYMVGTGSLLFIPAVIAGTLGNTLGNIITFLLVKKYEHTLARKILMLDEMTFKKIHSALHETFTHKGMWWLFIGKLTPSIKAFIPVVAGLAQTKTALTSLIFFVASGIWACGIIYLGKTFGEQFSLKSFMGVSLIVGLTILFIVYKNISKKFHSTKTS
jgi:membrane protein DedA with SNARE-associated domain